MFQTDLVEGLLPEGEQEGLCRLEVQQSLKVQPSLKVHHHGQRGQALEVEVLEVLEVLQVLDGSIEVAYEQS